MPRPAVRRPSSLQKTVELFSVGCRHHLTLSGPIAASLGGNDLILPRQAPQGSIIPGSIQFTHKCLLPVERPDRFGHAIPPFHAGKKLVDDILQRVTLQTLLDSEVQVREELLQRKKPPHFVLLDDASVKTTSSAEVAP